MTTVGEIIAKLSIVSSVQGDLAKANTQIQSGINKMGAGAGAGLTKLAATAGIAAAAVGTAAVAGIGMATKSYMGFEQTVANAASVTGLTGDAYKAALGNITAVSKELGESTVFSASDAANAMYDLASAGFDVANMAASDLKPILDLASGTQTDLTTTTQIVTDAISQFGLTTQDSGRVADVYAKTIGSSKATMDKLGTSMGYVGPIANSLGYSIEDTAAALGVLYNSGLDGSTAGTALRASLSSLLSPSSDAAAAIMAMGYTLEDVNPQTHSLTDILAKLASGGMDAQTAMEIFGREAGPAMLSLVSHNADVVKATEALKGAGGAAEDMANKQLDTLHGSIEMLKSAWEGLVLEVGEAFAPFIRGAADAVTAFIPTLTTVVKGILEFATAFLTNLKPAGENIKVILTSLGKIFGSLTGDMGGAGGAAKILAGIINTVTGVIAGALKFLADHPTFTKIILTVVGIVAGLAVLPAIVTAITGAIVGVIGSVMGVVGAVAGGVEIILGILTIITNPFVLIIAALVLLYEAWTSNWLGIRDKTAAAWEYIKGILKKAVDGVKGFVDKAGDKLLFILGPIGAIIYAFKHWDQIGPIVKGAFSKVYTTVTGFVGGIIGKILDMDARILAYIRTTWDNIKKSIADRVASIITQITQTWSGIQQQIASIQQRISQTITAAWDGIRTWLTNAVTGIYNGITSTWDRIHSYLTGAMDAIRNAIEYAWLYIHVRILQAQLTISTRIRETWDGIRTYLVGILAGIYNAFVAGLTTVYNFVVNILTNLYNAFSRGLTIVYNFVVNILTNLYNAFVRGLNIVYNFVSGILTTIYNTFAGIMGRIYTYIVGVLATIYTAYVTALNRVITFVAGILTTLYNSFVAGLTRVYNYITGVLTGIYNRFVDLRSRVTGAVNDIVATVQTLGDKFWAAGVAAMDKLIGGISSKINEAVNKAKGVVSSVSSALGFGGSSSGGSSRGSSGGSSGGTGSAKYTTVSAGYNPYSPKLSVSGYKSGASVSANFAAGISSSVSKVTSAVSSVVGKISSYLPHSPAKIGPLSKLPNWDAVFYDPLKASVTKAGTVKGHITNTLSKLKAATTGTPGTVSQIPVTTSAPQTLNPAGQAKDMGVLEEIRDILRALKPGGDSYNISGVTVASDYDVDAILNRLEARTREKRIRRGTR